MRYVLDNSSWSEVFGSSLHMSKTVKLAPFDRFRDFTFIYKQTRDLLVHLSDVLVIIVEPLCSSAKL